MKNMFEVNPDDDNSDGKSNYIMSEYQGYKMNHMFPFLCMYYVINENELIELGLLN